MTLDGDGRVMYSDVFSVLAGEQDRQDVVKKPDTWTCRSGSYRRKAQVTTLEPKKKKQKGIGSFFAQKSQDVVRKEREAAALMLFANNTATQ